MRDLKIKIIFFMLAFLIFITPLTVSAAEDFTLIYSFITGSSNAMSLSVEGTFPEKGVYAAQIEMEFYGSYPDAKFKAADAAAYCPDIKPSVGGGKTQITIYIINADKPMDSGKKLALGSLYMGKETNSRKFTVPANIKMTLLGEDLRVITSANGITVPTKQGAHTANPPQGGGSGTGGGVISGGAPAGVIPSVKYSVNVVYPSNGAVQTDVTGAASGEKVNITVVPDMGYRLSSLTVTDTSGRLVTTTQTDYSSFMFTMPGSSVIIRAAFEISGNVTEFEDVVQSNWFYDAVRYVGEKGMMDGTGKRLAEDGTVKTAFSPFAATRRGMIVTILYRMENSPETQQINFNDVAQDMYYAKAVSWAAENKIADGYGDGNFGPEDEITREQFVCMMYRYANYKGYNTQSSFDLSQFADLGDVSGYAVEPMRWACELELIKGIDPETIYPKGSTLRAEAAAILMRFCENAAK